MIVPMTPSGESSTPQQWDDADIKELHAEALDVLSDAKLWQLAETRWQTIEQVLATMDAALTSGDIDALAEATAALELAGPLRILPIGPAVGPTPVARDLLNKLVHFLGGVSAKEQVGEPTNAGAGDAGISRS
jgi:hypothetical protein